MTGKSFGNMTREQFQSLVDGPCKDPIGPPASRGYAATPGTGPKGETCESCTHFARIISTGTHLRCGLMKEFWGGSRIDIKARAPACARWEAIVKVLVLVALLTIPASALARDCHTSKPSRDPHWWSWRLVDGKRCWYQGHAHLSKGSLRWHTAVVSNPVTIPDPVPPPIPLVRPTATFKDRWP